MTRLRWILSCCTVVLLAGSWVPVRAANSPVEELTKVMPDGVMAFVATSGFDALKGDFEQSTIGRMVNDPSMQSFVKAVETELMSKAQEEGEDEFSQRISTAVPYVELVLSRPVVVGIAGAEVEDGPPVCAFAILDAGQHKADFVAVLEQMEQAIGKDEIVDIEIGSLKMRGSPETDDLSVYWGWVGNYLLAAINDQQRVLPKYLNDPRSAVVPYLNKVPGHGDALALYYDYSKLLSLVNVLSDKEEVLEPIEGTLAELGVTSLGSLAARVEFSGPDLVSRSTCPCLAWSMVERWSPVPSTTTWPACTTLS